MKDISRKSLFLIFNHTFTDSQHTDAEASLSVERIVSLPEELQALWSSIPPQAKEIRPVLEPIRDWLASEAREGDFVLIQGDFGATYLMVQWALELGLIPVYSTTVREADEELQPDGTVKLTHRFQHRMFRKYGV